VNALARLAQVLWIVCRYRLDDALIDALIDPLTDKEELSQNPIPRRYLWLLRLSPTRLFPIGQQPRGRRLRLALEALGPVFIKFGQLLSTRRDLIPLDIADELAQLQDQVSPFPGEVAVAMVEQALGQSLAEAFAEFDIQPMASASVAQVHAATLPSGEKVVVKVVRPDIAKVIQADVALLRTLADWLENGSPDARRLHLHQVVADYEQTIVGELDMLKEADNTAQLRNNFAGSELLYVPRVHWQWCRPNVLVLERIFAVPIADVAQLRARGTNMKRLAERGVETFFTQVFVDNFFHADMHPGNIFVNIDDPENPSYIAIDCAIIGTLTGEDQDYLARNLLAFFNQDYAEVARLHVESGWVPQTTDPIEFERVIRDVCEPIFAKPLSEISFGQFLVKLFETASDFDMEIQPQLVLLQKTLLYIEGLGRELYPQLDLWQTAKPFMESWMSERVGPAAALREFAEHAPQFIAQLPRLPGLVIKASHQLRTLEHVVDRQTGAIATLETRLDKLGRRTRGKRLAGATLILIASGLLWGPISQSLQGSEDLGTLAGLLSAAIGSLLLVRT
jgi:ubiquinone biosynthesis protein